MGVCRGCQLRCCTGIPKIQSPMMVPLCAVRPTPNAEGHAPHVIQHRDPHLALRNICFTRVLCAGPHRKRATFFDSLYSARERAVPTAIVILSKALVLASSTSTAAASSRGGDSTRRWRPSWAMGKARDKSGKRGAGQGNQGGKASERSERARLRKERQRNSASSYYCSDADDREFEAQASQGHTMYSYVLCRGRLPRSVFCYDDME